MKPILRMTLAGIVDRVTDTQVMIIFETDKDLFEQTFPVSDFEQLPKAGDKVVSKVLLGIEEPAIVPKPIVPRILEPVVIQEPKVRIQPTLTRKQRGLIDDDDDNDILDNGLGD